MATAVATPRTLSANDIGIAADRVSKMAAKGQTNNVGYRNSAEAAKQAPVSPTVISDTNIRDNVIPNIQQKAQQMLPQPTDSMAPRTGETMDAYTARVSPQTAPGATQDPNATSDTTQGDTGLGSEYDAIYKSAFGTTPAEDNFYDSDLALLDSMKRTSDAKTSNQLAGISAQYKQRQNDLRAQQAATTQSATSLLNRTGAIRSGSGQNLIGAVSRGYIREASNIDLQEQQATNEALAAQADNDYKLLGEKLDVLKDKRQEKLDVVNKLYDNMVAERQKNQDNVNAVLESAAEAGAPQSVQDMISASGDAAGAIKAAGAYLQKSSDPQMQRYIEYRNAATAAGVAPMEYDNWETKDNQKQANLEYSKAYASAKGAAVGKAAGEASVGGGTPSDYAGTIDRAANKMASVTGQASMKSSLTSAISNGDYTTAGGLVTDATAAGLTAENKTKFQNAAIDNEMLSNLETSLQELADSGYDTSLLTGTADEIHKKLGTLGNEDPKYAALATELDRNFQQYRQNMTGAAFGAAESSEYAKVLPAKSNTLELNLALIKGAKDYNNSYVEGAIRSQVGDGGVDIYQKGLGGSAPVNPVVQEQQDSQNQLKNWIAASPENGDNYEEYLKIAPNASPDEVLSYFGVKPLATAQ